MILYRFRISNPRKGTETLLRLQFFELGRLGFRISNPRKGTETRVLEYISPERDIVSAYLIPARGLKHELADLEYWTALCFRISNPRKGTETLL